MHYRYEGVFNAEAARDGSRFLIQYKAESARIALPTRFLLPWPAPSPQAGSNINFNGQYLRLPSFLFRL